MPGGDAFWLCHECRAEMRPIERNGSLTCASCGGEFIEILDEDVNPDPYAEVPHPPTRPGAPRAASPSRNDNPDFFSHMFSSLLNAQPGQQAPPQNRGQGSSSSAIASLGSPAAMHGQRPPGQGTGRSYDFNIPGGGQGRIMFGGFGGSSGGGGGFMMGGGGGNQGGNPFFPGFQVPPNPHRTGAPRPPPIGMPQDDLLRGLMEMIADENGMAPQMLFGGMPGFGGPRGASSFGDYVTTQQGFDEVLERLMQAAGPQGPIPATEAVIDGLPRSTFDQKSLEASVYKDCPVCKDDFAVGDEYIRIPCAHIFHPDCLTPWLQQNGSCPVCRFSLVSDPGNAPAAAASDPAAPPTQPATSGAPSADTADQPESFFTSILNRLWGQGGEARSPTTETAPAASASAQSTAHSGHETSAGTGDRPPSASAHTASDDPPDPILQNTSSAIPDDYRERHRQREREQERQRNLPHDDLD